MGRRLPLSSTLQPFPKQPATSITRLLMRATTSLSRCVMLNLERSGLNETFVQFSLALHVVILGSDLRLMLLVNTYRYQEELGVRIQTCIILCSYLNYRTEVILARNCTCLYRLRRFPSAVSIVNSVEKILASLAPYPLRPPVVFFSESL